jgi:hypothetical protein
VRKPYHLFGFTFCKTIGIDKAIKRIPKLMQLNNAMYASLIFSASSENMFRVTALAVINLQTITPEGVTAERAFHRFRLPALLT